MTSNPKVSIITPTFNHELFIETCIKSVLAQTFSNWEMIIINDGSTDDTARIIQRIATTEPRIKVFNRENQGIFKLSDTYNFGLQYSKGEYIAILEGDDFWVKDKLEIQVNIMDDNPSAILCWGRATSVIENENKAYETHPKCESKNLSFYTNDPIGSFFNIIFDDFPAPLTFLIRKKTLIDSGSFRQILPFPAVDLPTILTISLYGKFIYLPIVLGSWRQHANQTTKNNSIDLLEGSTKIIMNHYLSLPLDVKSNINFDIDYINKMYIRRKIIGYSRSGRFKLIHKHFKEARSDYWQSIKTGNPFLLFSWKVRSSVGILFSYFNMNIEWLAQILGKRHFK